MYSGKESTNSSYNLRKFIAGLIEEYVHRLFQMEDQKKSNLNDIADKEAFIKTLSRTKIESSNLFSPNSKDYNIDDYNTELNNIREKTENIKKDQGRLECIILHLKEIDKALIDQESPSFNIGLNILEIQEQDRQRIARDLHDSTVQNLTSLIHKCELCSRVVEVDPVRAKLELNTMSNTLKAVINEIREIIYNLKPMSLDDLGLLTTIERYANQLMITHDDIDVRVTHNEEREDIIPVIKLSIFRMIQEACINAIKHSDAKCIDIDITYQANYITTSITDDGKGFDAEQRNNQVAPDYSGYGLSIMKERVYLLSGTMNIQSTINKGTIVTITVPITKSEGEE
jgi:two-component system sensor histidine kinase DegS